MRIGLIRHGETDWNARGLLQGTSDIPLNDRGVTQAHNAGRLLNGGGWQRVYATPLQRARHTAEIIAGLAGLEGPHSAPGFIERSFGELEGTRFLTIDGRRANLEHSSVEPADEVRRRARAAFDELAASHPDEGTLVVAHGTVIRLLLADFLEVDAPHISNVALSIIEWQPGEAPRATLAGGFPVA